MKPFTLKFFWNQKKEKTDILILLPHPGTWEDWMNMIYNSWRWYDDISHDILSQYISHEADRWSREIIYETLTILSNCYLLWDTKIGVFDIDLPRWICDLNRNWKKSCPRAIDSTIWKEPYDETLSALFWEISRSCYCLQFHTMNHSNPAYRFELSPESTNTEISRFLETCYSWDKRTCNILTEMISWEYVTSLEYDNLLKWLFYSHNIPLAENVAYRFAPDFPATEITRMIATNLVEITKDSLGTDDTMNHINSSKIILDPEKISVFAHIFSEFFVWLLHKSA